MNTQKLAEFKVTDHFYLKDRGGFVIGQIRNGIFKIGMTVSIEEDGNSLTISGIEYVDKSTERKFRNALLFKEKPELDLVKTIGLFDLNVREAAKNLTPKVISRYCHVLAVAFNSFYEKSKVLDLGDENLEKSRLCLVNSFKITIERALDLLGIVAPERM